MNEKMEARISELKMEYENGKKMLDDLDMRRTNLSQTLFRISGAIQALEELVSDKKEPEL